MNMKNDAEKNTILEVATYRSTLLVGTRCKGPKNVSRTDRTPVRTKGGGSV